MGASARYIVKVLFFYHFTRHHLQRKNHGSAGLVVRVTTFGLSITLAFLQCWKDAMERLELFQYRTDVLMYTSVQPTPEQLTFSPLNVTVHVYNNTGYHSVAVLAMGDLFLDGNTKLWFDEYDWVIRVNQRSFATCRSWSRRTPFHRCLSALV